MECLYYCEKQVLLWKYTYSLLVGESDTPEMHVVGYKGATVEQGKIKKKGNVKLFYSLKIK